MPGRATVTRRLCTIARFYKYAVEEELLEHSPAAHVRRPRLDYESHTTALDRNELGALLVARGARLAVGTARIDAPLDVRFDNDVTVCYYTLTGYEMQHRFTLGICRCVGKKPGLRPGFFVTRANTPTMKEKTMLNNVDFRKYESEFDEEVSRNGGQPYTPDRDLVLEGRRPRERTACWWIRRAAGAVCAATGGAVLGHLFLFLAISTVAVAAVILIVIVWMCLFLWTVLFGSDVHHERAFRFMRFIAAREEPPMTVLGLVPAQSPRVGDPSGAKEQAAEFGTGSMRVSPGERVVVP